MSSFNKLVKRATFLAYLTSGTYYNKRRKSKSMIKRDLNIKAARSETVKNKFVKKYLSNKKNGKSKCECDICKKKYKSKPGCRVHVVKHCDEPQWKCRIDFCRKNFNFKYQHTYHVNHDHTEYCYICDEKILGKTRLIMHIKKVHKM